MSLILFSQNFNLQYLKILQEFAVLHLSNETIEALRKRLQAQTLMLHYASQSGLKMPEILNLINSRNTLKQKIQEWELLEKNVKLMFEN